MTPTPFLRPRLTGTRFDDHTIPLEFLKDLAVLNEMIVEVAKWEFLKAHPDRKRSPRGFTEGIELKLTGIESGSAKPVISLVAAVATLFPLSQLYFEKARDRVINAVSAAEQNQVITDYLPEKVLNYFDRMGRSLRDGEAMEFVNPNHAIPVARLTRETRRKLVLASSQVRELTEECSVRGAVPEADLESMTFHVQLADGRKVRAPIEPQHLDPILEAFMSYRTSNRLRLLFQGIGRLDRYNRLLSFDSIEHVSILDALDIPARLDELALLKPGWLEGRGLAPNPNGIHWISHQFGTQYPEELPLPYLYPTEEGGIQAEWTLGATEVTLEIDLTAHTGRWHTLNMATDEEQLRELDLNNTSDWAWVAEQIQQMAGGPHDR